MKKSYSIATGIFAAILFASCASTPDINNEKHSEEEKTSSKAVITVQKSPEELFLESLEGISIKKISSPKEVTLGRKFSEPFVFQVLQADGSPKDNFSVTVTYPEAKSLEKGIIYNSAVILSDEEGKIIFTPENNSFAVNAKVTAIPTPIESADEETAEKLKENLKIYMTEANWKVKSDIASKGAALFVWDFNEKDRPVNNSYNIQAEFRGRGITNVGNGPVNESSYIGKIKSLYKDTYDIIGTNVYGYLVFGTIKFEEPVTAMEDGKGYYCVLKADIGALRMKDGNQIYSSVITYKAEGQNWNECVSKGKDKLSKLVVDDIIYGL